MAPDTLPKLPNNSEPHEIPIAARLKGPGPAAYSLPPTLGYRGTINVVRAPAYSFGMKLKSERDEKCPGPNMFFPLSTRKGLVKGPAFSLQGGYRKTKEGGGLDEKSESPGPGKYYPVYFPSKEPKAPAYSIAPRRIKDNLNDNPGPAQYGIQPTLGMKPIVTVPAAAAYSIKPRRPIKLDHESPGPAAYNPFLTQKKKSAGYSIGGKLIKESKDTETEPTPGPGQYSPKLKYIRGKIPQYSFRCKHSEYELFIPDPVDNGGLE